MLLNQLVLFFSLLLSRQCKQRALNETEKITQRMTCWARLSAEHTAAIELQLNSPTKRLYQRTFSRSQKMPINGFSKERDLPLFSLLFFTGASLTR